MRGLVVAALVTVSTPAAAKPGFIVVPPIEAELGAGTPIGEATPIANSTELRVGMHSASLYWKPTRFDVGIGYAGSFRTLPLDSLARTDGAVLEPPELRLHGLYFTFNYAVENHKNWRTWIGARVDGMSGDYQGRSLNVFGGAIRLGAEIYAAGVGAAGDNKVVALMAGAWALGVYVEGTARTLPDELGPIGIGAGMSVRVPFLLAAGS